MNLIKLHSGKKYVKIKINIDKKIIFQVLFRIKHVTF